MKRLFWGNDNREAKPGSGGEAMVVPNTSNETLPKNMSADFQKYAPARPFVFASFTAWPIYWLFKGLEWSRNRRQPVEKNLATYIKRTHFEAKVIQIGIISLGVMAVLLMNGFE